MYIGLIKQEKFVTTINKQTCGKLMQLTIQFNTLFDIEINLCKLLFFSRKSKSKLSLKKYSESVIPLSETYQILYFIVFVLMMNVLSTSQST